MAFELSPIHNTEKNQLDIGVLTEKVITEAGSVEIKPEDRNDQGQLLASPEGPVSHLSELEWKMVRTQTFKKWFEGSVVVDENGEPLVVYHGSSEQFDKFDLGKAGANKDSGFLGKGLYFTPHQELAEKYGSVLYKTFLKIDHLQMFTEEQGNVRYDTKPLPENIHEEVFRRYKPLQEQEYERLKKEDEAHRGDWSYMASWNGEDKFEYIISDIIRQVLTEQGFDGVLGYNPLSQVYEYVAFNEDDIMIVPDVKKSS